MNALLSIVPQHLKDKYTFQKIELEDALGISNPLSLKSYLRQFPDGPHAAHVYRKLAEPETDRFTRWYYLLNAVEKGDVEPYIPDNRWTFAEVSMEIGDTETALKQWKKLVVNHVRAPRSYVCV